MASPSSIESQKISLYPRLMPEQIEIRVLPEDIENESRHRRLIAEKLKTSPDDIVALRLVRRSLDARHGQLRFQLRFEVARKGETLSPNDWSLKLQDVSLAPEVIVVGSGPTGLFCALRLIELGFRPIVLERGKAVRDRRHDIARLTKQGEVNPESNYCFGEGGAGTFSDGKLYTRSQKRGSLERILRVLHAHGADEDILVEAHPHIGTNRLPAVVQSIRESILSCGGSVLFSTKVSSIVRDSERVRGVGLSSGETITARSVVFATGHSARDVFRLIHEAGLLIERKPFAVGVRIEHPQPLINAIQYGKNWETIGLPSASYALKAQANQRGVFSFCMCPGGIICPAATQPNELVVNGWSPSKRNSKYANSGMVVEVPTSSFASEDVFAGIEYQQGIEEKAFLAGGGRQKAPAQRLTDFLSKKVSSSLPESSYLPGTTSADLNQVLPEELASRLAEGFRQFGSQMRGYITEAAVLLAPESRTSSPIRVPRDPETFMHPQLQGLFPAGEGGGYAGGIVSAAMDGERVAEKVGEFLQGGRE